jgi:hypothetical protein
VDGPGWPTNNVHAAITRVEDEPVVLFLLLVAAASLPKVTIADPYAFRFKKEVRIVIGLEVWNGRPSGRTLFDVNSARKFYDGR